MALAIEAVAVPGVLSVMASWVDAGTGVLADMGVVAQRVRAMRWRPA